MNTRAHTSAPVTNDILIKFNFKIKIKSRKNWFNQKRNIVEIKIIPVGKWKWKIISFTAKTKHLIIKWRKKSQKQIRFRLANLERKNPFQAFNGDNDNDNNYHQTNENSRQIILFLQKLH